MTVAASFLGNLYAYTDTGWLTLFSVNRVTGEKPIRWTEIGDTETAAMQATELAASGCVWFGVAPREAQLTGGRRGGAADCLTIPALWLDIDIRSDAHASEQLPETLDDALALLDEFPLPATAVVDSGHGLQAWWQLSEPLAGDMATTLLADWGSTWAQLGDRHGWHIDNVFDLARVMRLPGTWNRKSEPKLVTIISQDWDRTYGVDDIDGHLTPAPTLAPEQATRRDVPYIGPERPGDAFNAVAEPGSILERAGFHYDHSTPDGARHYRAPHRTKTTDTTGATVYADGHTTLWSETFAHANGMEVRRPYDAYGLYVHIEHRGDWQAATRALRSAGYGADEMGAPLTPWEPPPMPSHNPTTRLELAHLVDWQRFWDNDQSDENWLAYPIVPAGRAIALYAPAKAGKSTITLAIAAAVATGRPVLGKRVHPITEVLYLDYEMTPADLQQRLLELGYGPDDDLEHLHYALLPSLPPLDTVEGATAVLELIDTTGAEFVVVDTFGRAVGGEEDHADTVRAFYRHTGLSLKARGVTYLRTDHSGKDVAKGMRGSSAKNDDVDLVWQLSRTDTKDGHGVRLKRTHSRVSWVPEEVKVKRIETDDGFDYLVDGDVKVRPDGTRQIMEQMIALGITASTGQRPAAEILKAAGIKVKVREMREALGMLRETTANGLSVVPSLTPWTPQTPRQDSVAVETAQARQDSVAVGSNPVALVAVKGHMGSERDNEEATSVALDDEYRDTNASPLGLALSHQPTGTDEWLF